MITYREYVLGDRPFCGTVSCFLFMAKTPHFMAHKSLLLIQNCLLMFNDPVNTIKAMSCSVSKPSRLRPKMFISIKCAYIHFIYRQLPSIIESAILYSYFMPVWGVVKTAAPRCLGQLYALLPEPEGNAASSCPRNRGAVVLSIPPNSHKITVLLPNQC